MQPTFAILLLGELDHINASDASIIRLRDTRDREPLYFENMFLPDGVTDPTRLVPD
jgi:hypothetical protein